MKRLLSWHRYDDTHRKMNYANQQRFYGGLQRPEHMSQKSQTRSLHRGPNQLRRKDGLVGSSRERDQTILMKSRRPVDDKTWLVREKPKAILKGLTLSSQKRGEKKIGDQASSPGFTPVCRNRRHLGRATDLSLSLYEDSSTPTSFTAIHRRQAPCSSRQLLVRHLPIRDPFHASRQGGDAQ